ncbi:hypothetical protein BA6E_103223, partial [Bacteroidales bacterium 6E]
TASSVPSPIF